MYSIRARRRENVHLITDDIILTMLSAVVPSPIFGRQQITFRNPKPHRVRVLLKFSNLEM
jgi:hypothetical protein